MNKLETLKYTLDRRYDTEVKKVIDLQVLDTIDIDTFMFICNELIDKGYIILKRNRRFNFEPKSNH